jgi:ATP-binding cassette subfamily F protein 3
MLLSCQNISKAFVEKVIIQNISFHIEEYDKVAIVGPNGAGKTTLLRIIAGEMSPDSGQAVIAKDKTFGYLAQNQAVSSENTIYGELILVKADLIKLENQIREAEILMKDASKEHLEQLLITYARLTHEFEFASGYAYRSELVGVLKGLGFTEDEFEKSIATLSGGQKTRVALGKLLLQKPDLILLDEPTNHLDISAVAWLETYLQNYKGTVVIISHDRYFLDRIVSKVVELNNTKAALFIGNYSVYADKKEKLRADAMKAYLNQQQEIGHQKAVIAKLRQFNREKHIKRAKSREKALAKVEVMEKPALDADEIRLELKPFCDSGNDVLSVIDLAKSFGNLKLFEKVNFNIRRGEHVAIIGDNGTGKTTLLKILNGTLGADRGSFILGAKVHIGYYDQEHHILDQDKSLIMEIADAYPTLSNTNIRNMLAAFLFTGDDVFKRIGDLSGGEKGRAQLAKLMLSQANFLIFDEPTNHLDAMSREVLENALNRYTGTVLYVSHDRYFINKTATRILDLAGQNFIDYPGYDSSFGNYDYYLEKKEMPGQGESFLKTDGHSPASEIDRPSFVSEAKNDYLLRKEKEAAKRKRENHIRRLEEKITETESQLRDVEMKMLLPELASNAEELMRLASECETLECQLSAFYEEWEAVCSGGGGTSASQPSPPPYGS